MNGRKMTIGFYSFSSCDGCRYEVLNLGEKLLDFLQRNGLEIAYEPLLGLSRELEYYDIVFVEGSPTTPEGVKKLIELRRKAKILVALGSCSVLGGVQGMMRMFKSEDLQSVYGSNSPMSREIVVAKPISEYVKVDYRLRGCPINAQELLTLLSRLAGGEVFKQLERRFEFCRPSTYTIRGSILELDGSKCILCGRCVAVCSHLGIHALGLVNRGIETAVATPFFEPFDKTTCILCGLCTTVCPVDALRVRSDVERVQKILKSGGRLDVYIEAEALAALAAKYGLDDWRKLVTALKKLGFNRVFVFRPLPNAESESVASRSGRLTIVPASVAERLFIEKFYPQLLDLVVEPSQVPSDGLIVSACAARKLQRDLVLTARELDLMLRRLDIIELPPSEPDGMNNSTEGNHINVVGPHEVRRTLDAISNGVLKEGKVVLYICPHGCMGGGGQPYMSEDLDSEVETRRFYLEKLYKLNQI